MFLRMYQQVMLGAAPKEEFRELSVKEGFILLYIITIIIYFGVNSGPVADLVRPAVDQIIANI